MKVTAILKGQPDKDNRLPVVIRINEGNRRSYRTTAFRVKAGNLNTLKKDDPGMYDLIYSAIREEERRIAEGKKRVKDAEFFTYVKTCMAEWTTKRAYNTLRNYRAETQKIRDYKSSFKISEVDNKFLTGYSQFLFKKGNQKNTVWTSFKFLRTVVLKAKRERLIAENPFDTFEMPQYRDPQKNYLTRDEIEQIETWLPQAGGHLLSATWFVIGCYTGLRYSDMNAFSKDKNIKNGRLVLKTKKTGEVISMPLNKKVKELFEKIHYQNMIISNQNYNEALKKIGKAAGVGEDITAHISRHTFGVLCAASGISQEVTSKLMGHRDMKSTLIYYKLANPRIDKELDKLFR